MKRQSQKSTKQQYDDEDVFFTIIDYWGIKEEPWLKMERLHEGYLADGQKWSPDELYHFFINDVLPKLLENMQTTINNDFFEDKLYILNNKDKYYRDWMRMARLDECILKDKTKWNTYPTLNVRTHRNSSNILGLHSIPARMEEYYQDPEPLVRPFWGRKMVASHLCHTKNCLVCAVKDPKSKNTHRNYCVAFQLVDRELMWICNHVPRCRNFGPNAFYKD